MLAEPWPRHTLLVAAQTAPCPAAGPSRLVGRCWPRSEAGIECRPDGWTVQERIRCQQSGSPGSRPSWAAGARAGPRELEPQTRHPRPCSRRDCEVIERGPISAAAETEAQPRSHSKFHSGPRSLPSFLPSSLPPSNKHLLSADCVLGSVELVGTQQDRQKRSRRSLEEKEISNKRTREHSTLDAA